MRNDVMHAVALPYIWKLAQFLSYPEVLFKAATLLVNILYIFIYAYMLLP